MDCRGQGGMFCPFMNSTHLAIPDAIDLLALAKAMGELPHDGAVRIPYLLGRLIACLDAQSAFWCVFKGHHPFVGWHTHGSARHLRTVPIAEVSDKSRQELQTVRQWMNACRRCCQVGCLDSHWICWARRIGAAGDIEVFSARRDRAAEAFSAREETILKLLESAEILGESSVDMGSPGLSVRRKQVLQALLRGRSEKETAQSLGISFNTVHVHVKRLYRTFRVSSRAELISRCFQQSLAAGRTAESKCAGNETSANGKMDEALQTVYRDCSQVLDCRRSSSVVAQ